MFFPDYFTADDIMQFEYEYARYLAIENNEGDFWAVNAELQVVAQEQHQQDLFA